MKINSPTSTLVVKEPDSPGKDRRLLIAIALLCVASVGLYWLRIKYLSHPVKPAPLIYTIHIAPTASTTGIHLTGKKGNTSRAAVSTAGTAEKTLNPKLASKPTMAVAAARTMEKPVTRQGSASASIVAASAAGATSEVAISSTRSAGESRLLQAAQISFDNVMDKASQYPDAYGFKSGDLIMNARLGESIPIYTIAGRDCAAYQPGQPIQPLLKKVDHWMFPVLLGNQIRCMIEVSRDGQNYIPGGGSKLLAISWNKILEKWPASKGYHPQLIINPEIPGYYFTVPELQNQNLTDINHMIFSDGDLSPAAVILASWS